MKIKKILSYVALLSILLTVMPISSFADESVSVARNYTDESKFVFDENTNTITKFTGDETEVVIPTKINGVEVKAIGKMAFKGKKIKSVVLNEGLEVIGNGAFAGVSTLEKINFPSTLKKIDDMAFVKTSLKELKLNEGLQVLGKRAFSNCSSLQKINLPNSLTKISDNAFEKCKISNDIVFGENLGHVGHKVFSGNGNDINISISKNGNKLFLHDELFLKNQNELNIPQGREIMLFVRAFCDSSCSSSRKITLNCGEIEVNENDSKEDIIKKLKDKIKLTSGFVKIGGASDGSLDEYFEAEINYDVNESISDGSIISGKFKKFKDEAYVKANQNKELIESVLDRYEIEVKVKVISNSKEFNAEDFNYEVVKNKIISKRSYFGISGFSEKGLEKLKTNKDLVIPKTVIIKENGIDVEKRIEGICPKAFENKELNSVKINISEGYNEYIIDTGAFQKNNLKEFEIPDGVKFIESYAFKNNKIKKLFIPQTVVKVGNESFAYNEIEELKVSDSVSLFQFDSFSFAHNKIKEVDLPFSIFKLLQNVFVENTGNEDGKVILYTRNKKHLETSTYINPHSDYHRFVLVGKDVNRNKLQKILEIAKELDKSDYEATSFENLENIYAEAKIIMLNHNSTQKEIDEITKSLSKAIENLVPNGANKKALIKNISRLSNINKILYTEDSYNKFIEELEKAKAVVKDASAKQDDIDKALLELLKAEGKLVLSEEAKYNKNDFIFEGTKIVGFSELGKEKSQYNKNLIIPNKNENGEDITEIGDNAFEYTGEYEYTTDTGESLNGLLSVEIPKTVKKIGKSAFQKNKLKEVILPEGLEEIGTLAFNGNQLVSIEIPNSVVKMGEGTFSLNNISYAKLSKNMKTVPNGIFSRNLNLKNIDIPDGVEKIGQSAFSGCPLESINIPNTVKKIERYAFLSHRISTLEIPSSVETIEDQAFASNKKFRYLKNLILNEGLKTIGKDSFKSCLIEEVVIPSSLTFLDKNAFNDNMDSEKNVIKVKVYTYNKEHLKFEQSKHHEIILKDVNLENLKTEIEKAKTIKNSDKYIYSDENIKSDFDKILKDCEEALNNPISQKNIDSLTKALNENLLKLNGVKPSDPSEKPEDDLITTLTDPKTNISVSGKRLSDFILVVEKINGEDFLAFKGKDVSIFDISFVDKKTNKKVKIKDGDYTVSIPREKGKTVNKVYYIDKKGNLEEKTFTQNEKSIIFKTGHFSMYAVEYKKGNNEKDKIIDKDKVIDKNKTNKKLPKTNVSSNSILVPTLLGIASIITIKKKYK